MKDDRVICYKTGGSICTWNFTIIPRVGEKIYFYCYYEVVDVVYYNVESKRDFCVNIKVKKCQ